jgi:hypothetical protein
MKKLMAWVLAASCLPSVALARGNHPMAGCGLAYVLFSKDDNSQGIQILASTTNNLWGTQSFGITSGTSGCTPDGTVAKNKEAEVFADVNYKNLQQEMAVGGGEYLNAFADILGVKADRRADLFQIFRQNYASFFPSSADSTHLLDAVYKTLEENPSLVG